VDDRIINDQPAYRKHLNILLRSCALRSHAPGSTVQTDSRVID
jgi:hypothetical protein